MAMVPIGATADQVCRLGDNALNRGELLNSLAFYQAALDRDPDHVRARCGLGVASLRFGNAREAARHFRLAIEVAPADRWARLLLAEALTLAGDLDQAEAVCRALLDADADSGQAHSRLGIINALRGRIADADECFARAVACDPGRAEYRTNRARLAELAGELEAMAAGRG